MGITIRNRPKLLALMLAAGVTIPQWLPAQASEGDDRHLRNVCRLAEQVIRTGQPANKHEWAWAYMAYCPLAQQIPLRVLAMHAARSTHDSEVAQAALMPLGVLHDGTLFQEVLAVADDRQATSTARVVAWMSLYALAHPDRSVRYEHFVRLADVAPGSTQCSGIRMHPAVPEQGATSLPSAYREQVRAVARRVAADESEPRAVRGAAGCLM
ncbi:MAG TPA: hypothetical protein VF665_24985 [Longimicrobium sp.]|jgi:hypothetical protein|uniref:hypothetical protein n=1 Tax=Longimicrobium sp. TaxID=2029185 RepID=UPI002ED81643